MPKATILLFANLREKAGTNRIEIDIPESSSISDIKEILGEKYPALKPQMNHVIASVNQQFALDDEIITEDSEIAFFPPVSGGSEQPTIIKIAEEALDQDDIIQQITRNTIGAACTFTGIVRGITQRDPSFETQALEYEAYSPMAETKMEQVAKEIRDRWPEVQGIAIVQRIGRLKTGTPSVTISCTAAHRDSGVFEAARYGIERLKEIVPVWKKEVSPEGEIWINGDYIPEPGD